jgi:uncharacterized membrane protein
MDWILFAVQWLHVVLAILWFGGILFSDFILIPAFDTLPLATRRAATAAIGVRANKVLPPAAMAVIALGIVRGTVFGPIKSIDALFGTAYGITWLVALLVSIGVVVFAIRVIGPMLESLASIPETEAQNADGSASPRLVAVLDRIKRLLLLELGLFLVIFTCMILMRFGL